MLFASDLLCLQREQYQHDRRNHADIQCLHKTDRLKHYGLHYAKYVGRLARGSDESKTVDQTLTDAFLVSLSAANTLHQDLSRDAPSIWRCAGQADPLYTFADAAGRFADACEKIDHAEAYLPIAFQSNRDIVSWLLGMARARDIDLAARVAMRRRELAARQFYVTD